MNSSAGQPGPVSQSQWAAADAVEVGPAPGWKYGGFWIRFVANVLDTILVWIVLLVVVGVLGRGQNYDTWDDASRVIFGVVTLSALFLYYPLFWGLKGQTPGMIPFGLVIRRPDGLRIGIGRAFLRFLGFIIASIPLYLGLIWAGFDRRKQGWHDKIADTVVVRPG